MNNFIKDTMDISMDNMVRTFRLVNRILDSISGTFGKIDILVNREDGSFLFDVKGNTKDGSNILYASKITKDLNHSVIEINVTENDDRNVVARCRFDINGVYHEEYSIFRDIETKKKFFEWFTKISQINVSSLKNDDEEQTPENVDDIVDVVSE